MTLRGQRRGHHWDETYSKESFLPDKPTSWLKYYKALSRLKLVFPAKLTFLFNKVTFHLNFQNDTSQKNREVWSLVVRPWEKLKNLETHGRIMRAGRSVSPRGHAISSIWLSILLNWTTFGTRKKGTRNTKRSAKMRTYKVIGREFHILDPYIFLVKGHMLILFFSFEFLSKRSYRLYPITIQLKIQAKY